MQLDYSVWHNYNNDLTSVQLSLLDRNHQLTNIYTTVNKVRTMILFGILQCMNNILALCHHLWKIHCSILVPLNIYRL